MSETVSLAQRRWESKRDPAAHSPRDMLVEAIRQIDEGEIDAEHMILCYGSENEDEASYGWLQAGPFRTLAMVGLVEVVKRLLARGA